MPSGAAPFSGTTGNRAAEVSLNAPGAGTSQTLTLNTSNADVNASGVTYYALVIGTSA